MICLKHNRSKINFQLYLTSLFNTDSFYKLVIIGSSYEKSGQ
uniref:Uncharacterized protein n=1 Tax=Rhizophora mucronata TaxID=61149 RepID=A0A2P2QME6_RHIMU